MHDSFQVRVDKAFGSLVQSPSAPTSSSLNSSLWCLTDQEIDGREWNRYKDNHGHQLQKQAYPSNVAPQSTLCLNDPIDIPEKQESDILHIDDDAEEQRQHAANPNDQCPQEWDIRSSIGLDPTLDHEEEEDEYDKVAVGREQAGDPLYMTNNASKRDYGCRDITCCNNDELPFAFRDVARCPGANRLAAQLKLSDPCLQLDLDFAYGSALPVDEDPYAVPYYVHNPSKYTRYALNSTNDDILDDESNLKAYMGFLQLPKNSNASRFQLPPLHEGLVDLPKSVLFTPKKKPSASMEGESRLKQSQRPIGGVVSGAQESVLCAMDEDHHQSEAAASENICSYYRPGRHYRTKARTNYDD